MQNAITATWQWPDKTVAVWDTDIAAFEDQREAVSDAEAAYQLMQADLDVNFGILHARTVRGVSMLKNHFRDDEIKTEALQGLKAGGGGRDMVAREALSFESAWEKNAPAWVAQAGETLALFKTMREARATDLKTYLDDGGDLNIARSTYNKLGRDLNEDCMAWYSDGTDLYAEGTVEGDLIRTVPTSYDPQRPGKAVITDQAASDPGNAHIEFEATGAVTFDVWRKDPMDTLPVKVASAITATSYDETGLDAGTYDYYVVGRNSHGMGEQSDTVSLAVL